MKRRQRIIETTFQEIAKKHGVSYRNVIEVEDSMWKMTKELITTRDDNANPLPAIYLRFLGTIFNPPNMIKRINEAIEKKRLKDLNENT